MFTFIHTLFYSLSTVLCVILWFTKESQIVLGLQRIDLWKEAGADKWKLLFRSLVSEPDYSSDYEGGTCTRSMVAACQKTCSGGTQLEII